MASSTSMSGGGATVSGRATEDQLRGRRAHRGHQDRSCQAGCEHRDLWQAYLLLI